MDLICWLVQYSTYLFPRSRVSKLSKQMASVLCFRFQGGRLWPVGVENVLASEGVENVLALVPYRWCQW